jgi:hypothetical protein
MSCILRGQAKQASHHLAFRGHLAPSTWGTCSWYQPGHHLAFRGHLALHLGYWLGTSLATIWSLEVTWPSTWGTGLVPAWPPFGL